MDFESKLVVSLWGASPNYGRAKGDGAPTQGTEIGELPNSGKRFAGVAGGVNRRNVASIGRFPAGTQEAAVPSSRVIKYTAISARRFGSNRTGRPRSKK